MMYSYYYSDNRKTAVGVISADNQEKAIEILNHYYDGLDSNKLEVMPVKKDPNIVQEIHYDEDDELWRT